MVSFRSFPSLEQLQLQENLRLGSPPLVIASKKTEDAGTVSEDDGLPRSPPEISTLRDVLSCPARKVRALRAWVDQTYWTMESPTIIVRSLNPQA